MSLYIIGMSDKDLQPFKEVGFQTKNVNVQDILTQKWMGTTPFKDPLYFVSPANSLGYMDGGIDKAYTGMFNNIEQLVKNEIKNLVPHCNNVSKLGRPYLPIGSAIKIKADDENNYLISAPTMLQPQPVRDTKNAYWAMKAVLKVWGCNGTIFVPMMCCGYGKMDHNEAATQMKLAYDESLAEINQPLLTYYIVQPNLDEQPNYYENTEFKDIPIEKIMTKRNDEFTYFVAGGH